MAAYIIKKYQSQFNPDNFNNIIFFDTFDIAFKSVSNVFRSINTFLSDVLITGTLYTQHLK